jgi:hypothetical protein
MRGNTAREQKETLRKYVKRLGRMTNVQHIEKSGPEESCSEVEKPMMSCHLEGC